MSRLFLACIDGLFDALEHEILKKFGIFGVDDGAVYGDGENITGAIGGDLDLIAANCGFDGFLREFFLLGSHPSLHLLGLFHEFGDVHSMINFLMLRFSLRIYPGQTE